MQIANRADSKNEMCAYFLWGVISAVFNVGVFQLLIYIGINYKISNIITLVFIRIFCYVTNKFFVFHTRCRNYGELIKEICSFFLVRIISFFVDYFGLVLLIEVIGCLPFESKLITAFIVVISNYFFSKLLVFRKSVKDEPGGNSD